MSRSKVRIFDNEAVELLGVLFKRNHSAETFAKICELSHNLIQSILKSENYPNTDDVYHHLYLQMERWVERWVPGKGHLYAYLSASTKNAAVSFTTKEALHKSKVIGTDTPLEDLVDIEGNHHFDNPFQTNELDLLRDELETTEVRWPEPEIRAALRYCFMTIMEGKCRSIPDRSRIIRYLMAVEVVRPDGTTYILNQKQAKVLLAYAQGAVRTAFLNTRLHLQQLTENDMFKLRFEFNNFNDFEDVLGVDGARRVMAHFAGMTIKFPSLKVTEEVRKVTSSFNRAITNTLSEVEFVTRGSGSLEYDLDEDGGSAGRMDRASAMAVRSELTGNRVGTFRLYDQEDLTKVDDVLASYGVGE